MVVISSRTTASMVRIPKSLQSQQQKHVEPGNNDGPEQRDVEQQIESDGAAEHFGQIAGPNSHLAHQPVGPARPCGIPVAAALGEVFARNHAEAGGNHLHEDRHQAGEADHPQQSILELRSALQIRSPVAGIHVADADENCRTDESPPLAPEPGVMVRDGNGAMNAFERDQETFSPESW